MKNPFRADPPLASAGVMLLIALSVIGYGIYRLDTLSGELGVTRGELSVATSTLASTTGALSYALEENRNLSQALYSEQQKNDFFAEEIRKLAGTVGVLDKLSKTDPELLQKYSKVYFLNEHYTPAKLEEIPAQFTKDPSLDEEFFIHASVAPRLSALLQGAESAGMKLRVSSAYRSFDEQSDLKGAYTVSYGSGANRFSADQGYSEHQLGTTVDFTTIALGGGLVGFEKTPEYTWLSENAHRFGFILSYPEDNRYYIYEPWHWRYVGVGLATKLHADGTHFYDLDQRVIDSYLVSLFD